MLSSPIVKMLAQLVRDDHDGRAEAVAQLEDQVVEQARADRVEAGGRLVEEEDLGIERHGARQAGALLHAAADLRGIVVLEALQPDQRELERRHLADLGGAEVGVLAERQADVLGQRHRAPQRAALVEDADAPQDPLALLRRGLVKFCVAVEDLARAPARSGRSCARSSVLLPQPLPPMMMKISPRATVKSRSRQDARCRRRPW